MRPVRILFITNFTAFITVTLVVMMHPGALPIMGKGFIVASPDATASVLRNIVDIIIYNDLFKHIFRYLPAIVIM